MPSFDQERSINSPSPASASLSGHNLSARSESSQRHGDFSQADGKISPTNSSKASFGQAADTLMQDGISTTVEAANNGFNLSIFSHYLIHLTSNNLAISTLLQPPIIRTGLVPHATGAGAYKMPTAKEITPVRLTNIAHIDSKSFQSYLSQIGSVYDAFQLAKSGIDEGRVPPHKLWLSSIADPASELLGYSSQWRSKSATASDGTFPSPTSPLGFPRTKSRVMGNSPRRGRLPVTSISTVPNVYFEQNFRLENPRTFDIVSERSEIIRSPTGTNGSASVSGSGERKALATNAILQEKLSWYMDTVEMHLISSISAASTSFFAALGSLRELHLGAINSITKIQALRRDLGQLDKDMALGGLKLVAMRRRRENLQKLGSAVRQLDRVVKAMAQCEDQTDNGEIGEALKGLVEVERLIIGQDGEQALKSPASRSIYPEVLIDLRGVKFLAGAATDIRLLRNRIGKGFEAKLLEALLGDLRNHVNTVPPSSTFQRWDKASQRSRPGHVRTPSIFPIYSQLDEPFRSQLKAHLEGLSQSDSILPATLAYRESILKEIKNIVRRHLPSSSDDDNESTMSASTQGGRHRSQQEKSTILARNLRVLDAEDAEDFLKKIYSNVGEALRRLGTQVKVLQDLTSMLGSPPSSAELKPLSSHSTNRTDTILVSTSTSHPKNLSSQSDDIQQALDMSHLLSQAVDIAQGQITKILKVRSEQTIRLPLSYFLRYFHLNRLFADECEAVSGRNGAALRTVVTAHIKDFVAQFSTSLKQELLLGMDSDRWDAKDFGWSENQSLNRILEASTKDIEAWMKGHMIWESEHMSNSNNNKSNGQIMSDNGAGQDRTRSATVDEQKYILPESGLIVLRGIENFENLITGISNMTQEITSSLLEYLRLFNSRSQQLILGAGATKSAGLKNITTKHLALASQALSFVTALTPYVREFVRRHSSGLGSLMIEFDKLKREYQEHQVGINDKLVDIMSGRASAHISSMKKIKWDDRLDPQTVNGYMETLVKETTTLHKVLSKHLPEINVQMIMDPVFNSYREQWAQAFQDVDVKTLDGKQRYESKSSVHQKITCSKC